MSSNRFDHLTPVERGQDIRSVANSDRINAIQDILISLWQGDNISVGKGGLVSRAGMGGVNLKFKGGKGSSGAAQNCQPFKPLIVDKQDYSTNPDLPPDYHVSLEYGTVNGMVNPQWNGETSITQAQYDDILYIGMQITFADNLISSISYAYDSAPFTDDIDPVAINAIPTTLVINLGNIYKGKACMAVESSLVVTPIVKFKAAKSGAIPDGELGYDLYWGFLVRQV